MTAKHGLLGLARVVAKEGAEYNVRANVVCPGLVRTPLVERQIPAQARELGITEQQVIRNVMLNSTVDGDFTTIEDVSAAVLFFAGFPTNALTGQSIVVSHGWFMEQGALIRSLIAFRTGGRRRRRDPDVCSHARRARGRWRQRRHRRPGALP